jgi:4-amino-4-deoxy-L-arabinose transferase-like glycosyltransferase
LITRERRNTRPTLRHIFDAGGDAGATRDGTRVLQNVHALRIRHTFLSFMNRRSYPWILWAILSATGLVYLLGNQSVPLWDRDEPRYAQTSRQMLQSGDWVVPRFLDTVRTAKPVLIYWCQAASMRLLGDNAFAARFPSTIAMVLTLMLLAWVVWRHAGANRGLWTAFILGTSVLAIASAKMCLTDAVLLLFITVSQLCVYRLWRGGIEPRTIILLGVSIGLAGLTKGPVVLGVTLTTVLALWAIGRTTHDPADERIDFEPSQLPIILGVALALIFVVIFPWLWLIQERSPGFLTASIGHDVVERIQKGQEGHSGPPGTYLLLVWGTWFPWSLLLPAAMVNGWRHRHLPTTRFALAAVVGPWLMFELIATKLPHYVLPTFPALAYLTADLLIRASRGAVKDLDSRAFKLVALGGSLVVLCIGASGFAMCAVARQWDAGSIAASTAIASIAVIMSIQAGRRFWQGRVLSASRAMGIGTLGIVAAAYALLLPRLEALRLSYNLAQDFESADGYAARGYMIDFKEPSLAFHQGGGLVEQRDETFLHDVSPDKWPEWIVLTRRIWNDATPEIRAQWQVVSTRNGLALNGHGGVEVLILRKKSAISR